MQTTRTITEPPFPSLLCAHPNTQPDDGKSRSGPTTKPPAKGRPNPEETRRELHHLIRDTAGLVEVLNAQAEELEGQGWNLVPDQHWIARQRQLRG